MLRVVTHCLSRGRMIRFVGLLSAATLCGAAAVAQVTLSSQRHVLGVHRVHRAAQAPPASTTTTITTSAPAIPYNGGAVFPNATTYAIWWGEPADFPPDAREGVNDFLKGLDGTAYIDIADEYLFGQQARTRFGGNYFDTSPPTTVDGSTSSIIAEVYKVLTANGVKPDATALYAVYTSTFPSQFPYCAYHDYGPAADGTLIHVIYVPNIARAYSVCGSDNVDPLITPNSQSLGTRAMVNSTAHEVMESITDPNSDAWVVLASFTEIGDLCNFIFQSWVPLTNSRWKLQEIWSNQVNGCVQGAGRTGRVLGDVSNSGAITAFDIPAAIFGVFGQSNNNFGASTGYYADVNNTWHGFLRGGLGKIALFDAPGAGAFGTISLSISDKGIVTGAFWDTNFVQHGFVRDAQGNFVIFDAPGAAGTSANGINDNGATTGGFVDGNFISHGFVRDSQGNFVTFDAPAAGNVQYAGTTPLTINVNGGVTGNVLDSNSLSHGFVRHANGTIATFDVPGASQGTFAQSINDFGTIAGYYTDDEYVSHGFIRQADDTIVTFDDPYAATGGTFVYSINNSGAVGGYYSDESGFPRGFIRDKYGSFFTLAAPGANYGNVVRSVNDFGATAGYDTKPKDPLD
jgi:hypothetical protein